MKFLKEKKFENAHHEGLIDNINWNIEHMKELHPQYSAGEVSDGYHTFNELYHHRAMLFASLILSSPDVQMRAWKSKQHHSPDEPMYEGMFIVGVQTPDGQATYHYDMEYWDLFNCKEIERAPEYDGHTPNDAINRIYLLAQSIYRQRGYKAMSMADTFERDPDNGQLSVADISYPRPASNDGGELYPFPNKMET